MASRTAAAVGPSFVGACSVRNTGRPNCRATRTARTIFFGRVVGVRDGGQEAFLHVDHQEAGARWVQSPVHFQTYILLNAMNQIPPRHDTPPEPQTTTGEKPPIRKSQEEYIDDMAGPSMDRAS